MFNKDLTTFYKANIISLFAALCIAGFSFMAGKVNLFLWLNNDLGKTGDFVFNYITYLGDGLFLIPFALYILVFKRNKFLPAALAIIISVFIAHYVKGHLIINNPRPISVIKNWKLVHTISNIEIHKVGSFPSGHTTQAFTIFFLLCIFINNNKMLWSGFLLALLVGYSRVYQAQHFPRDVAGGIFVALVSVWLGLIINFWIKKMISGFRKTS